MPKLTFTVPEGLSAEEAVSRLHQFLPSIRDRYKDQVKDLDESWDGNTLTFSFKTMGINFKGTVEAVDKQVNVNIDLPFAAMMVKGRIEQEIRGGLERLLR